MIKNVYEILDEFEQASSKQERIEIIRNNLSHHFKEVLRYTFDPKYKFYIKEFPKDYVKPDTYPGLRYAGIESELRRVYLFLKGDPTADKLTDEKRNLLLVQLLESFEPREAVVFVNMLKKNLQIKHLTYNLVKEAVPNLLP